MAVRSPDRLQPPIAVTEVMAFGGVAALVAAFAISPDHIDDGPVICPFRRLTGLPCPGCGLTRSWVHLAHGQWGDALLANPFGLVTAAGVLALATLVVRARLRGSQPPDVDAFLLRPWVLAVLMVWLAFGASRIALQAF